MIYAGPDDVDTRELEDFSARMAGNRRQRMLDEQQGEIEKAWTTGEHASHGHIKAPSTVGTTEGPEVEVVGMPGGSASYQPGSPGRGASMLPSLREGAFKPRPDLMAGGGEGLSGRDIEAGARATGLLDAAYGSFDELHPDPQEERRRNTVKDLAVEGAQTQQARARFEMERAVAGEAETKKAWEDYGSYIKDLNQKLETFYNSGGQKPDPARAISPQQHQAASQSAFRQLLARLQAAQGRDFGRLAPAERVLRPEDVPPIGLTQSEPASSY